MSLAFEILTVFYPGPAAQPDPLARASHRNAEYRPRAHALAVGVPGPRVLRGDAERHA